MTADGSRRQQAHTDAVSVLSAWTPHNADQSALRRQFLAVLDGSAESTDRSDPHGHLTASCLVLDAAGRRVLLTLHAKVGRWLQTGGHIDPADRTLADAALREATEESGIDGLRMTAAPVQLDRHPVRCDGRDLDHLDVQYVAHAPAGARARLSAESHDLAWFDVDGLPADADRAVRSLVARAVALVDQAVVGGASTDGT